MSHVNAPILSDRCCIYHNTVVYLTFGLGGMLAGPCQLQWRPISGDISEMCTTCGLLFSKQDTCPFCTNVANFSDRASDGWSSAEDVQPLLINRHHFTNLCVNMLRHIGTNDFTTAIQLLLGVVVDLATIVKWQEFWNENPPCDGWRCA